MGNDFQIKEKPLFIMINHFLTLAKITLELENMCVGKLISSCLTFRKNEFHIMFNDSSSLTLFFYPSKPFMFYQTETSIQTKNTFYFFKSLTGKKLVSVSIADDDRMIKLSFDDQLEVIVQLFSASSGLSLYHNDHIMESIKHPIQRISPVNWVHPTNHKEFDAVLFKNLTFSKLIHSALFEGHIHIDTITKDVANISKYWVYQKEQNLILSPIQLPHLSYEKTFNIGSVAIRKFVFDQQLQLRFINEKQQLTKSVNQRIFKTQESVQSLNRLFSEKERGDGFELFGKLLMSLPSKDKFDLSEIIVDNWFINPPQKIKIKVIPDLTPIENAQKYFDKSKQFKQDRSEKLNLLGKKNHDLEIYKQSLDKIASTNTLKELNQVKKEFQFLQSNSPSIEQTFHEPFYRIQSTFGYDILVGKHAKGNDVLITEIANKLDIWLHCKGDSGSHVILPNRDKSFKDLNKIKEAAGYAAWFSNQRNSGWVPVTWTFAKYVRKVKGGAPGAVIVDREEILFVEPTKPPF